MYISATKKIKVGVFVFSAFLIVAVTLFVVIGIKIQDDSKSYYIVFRGESVSGLTVGSFLKYQGVEIGRVDDIRISSEDITAIIVDVSIRKDVKIKEDMVATLNFIGITGLKNVEIFGGSPQAQVIPEGGRISSRPSQFANMADNMDELMLRAVELLHNLSYVTNQQNRDKITNSLENIEQISSDVREFTREVKPSVIESAASLNKSIEQMQILFKTLTPMVDDMRQITKKLGSEPFLGNLDSLVASTNNVLTQTDSSLQSIRAFVNNSNVVFAEGRDDVMGIVMSLEEITRNLEIFSREVKSDPSVIMRGRRVRGR